jgi:hypothetical protein
MAVTGKDLSTERGAAPGGFWRRAYAVAYGVTLLLAVIAAAAVISVLTERGSVVLDDVRYGRPRTTHVAGFVGHGEAAGQPTHLTAINLNRQIVIVELPGGDAAQVRTLAGPYLFGADEHLTPVTLTLRDLDGDGAPDLLLGIRREHVVYLNRDGAFRLPTPEEQAALTAQRDP